MAPLEILISGAGVAGCTLATFLLLSQLPAEEKPRITILERASEMRAAGQNVDIRGAGLTVARKLGLETAIRSSTTGEEGAMLVDANNAVWGKQGADKTGRVQTGTSDIEILRGTLAEILFKRCRNVSEEVKREGGAGVEFIFGEFIESLEQDGEKVHVRFNKSGERRSYDYVVGADGLQSQTRRLAFGAEGDEDRLRKMDTYGAFFSMPSAPTDSEWRRWFRAPGRRSIMVRPSGTQGITTVFMTTINEKDSRLREVATFGNRGVKAQKALLRELFQGAGWETGRILDEMDNADDFYYDMIAQVQMPRWDKGRVVLAGDAGYCASPISGMGTTLALVGAYNLAGAIVQHPAEPDRAFADYEQNMRPVVEKSQKLAPGAPKSFMPETSWGIAFFHVFVWIIWRSNISYLLAMFAGPPANRVPVNDYGFRELEEWKTWNKA